MRKSALESNRTAQPAGAKAPGRGAQVVVGPFRPEPRTPAPSGLRLRLSTPPGPPRYDDPPLAA